MYALIYEVRSNVACRYAMIMHIMDLHKTMENDLQKDDAENPAI